MALLSPLKPITSPASTPQSSGTLMTPRDTGDTRTERTRECRKRDESKGRLPSCGVARRGAVGRHSCRSNARGSLSAIEICAATR